MRRRRRQPPGPAVARCDGRSLPGPGRRSAAARAGAFRPRAAGWGPGILGAAAARVISLMTAYEVLEEVRVDPGRAALIVVDMQNDFVRDGGSLRVPDVEVTIPAIS